MVGPNSADTGADIEFDPRDPSFVVDGVPFDVLGRIRRECPVYRAPSGNWYLARYADVEGALKDVDTFRADLGPDSGIPEGVATIPEDQHFLSEIPEPRHGAVRRLFNSAMATHRIRVIEGPVTAECHRLIDALLQADVADLHEDYAAAIPAFAMTQIMGVSPDAAPLFVQWAMDGTVMTRPATPGVPPEGPATHPFFAAKIAEERALPEPSNHLFKLMLCTEIEGCTLSDQEVITQLHFMIQAGVHTTRTLLVHLMNRLVHDPELYAALWADAELIPRFVEESLRHDSPVQRTTRVCTRDVVVDGVPIDRGQRVEMGIGSANRDEAVYDDGAVFRLDRADPRGHLSFGGGPHVCPGAGLARMEGAIALRVLLDRVRELRPVDGVTYPPLPGSLSDAPVPAVLVAR